MFEVFLKNAKDDTLLGAGRGGTAKNTCFIPRNFLIEERLEASRADSYADYLPSTGPGNFAEWNTAHNAYVSRNVFLSPPATHDYRVVERDDHDVCPETFRAPLALSAFQETDFDTKLIRMIPSTDIARLSRHSEDHIFSLGEQTLADPRHDSPAWRELSLILEEVFTGPLCQHRPVFAAFYEDFLNELREPSNPVWANRVRDRLGLYHINQWLPGGLPRRVFLFRYSVKDIPRHRGTAEQRPIALPVVIDQRLSEAFCPAPRELERGRCLNLEDGAHDTPAREVLHLFMPMQVEHLFRIGQVTTPVPEYLGPARGDHLLWLRLEADRDDYASETDRDLV